MAAIGGALAALRAGRTAEVALTRTPVSSETSTVRGARTMPPAGISSPNPESSARSPMATPTPAATPSSAAIRPTTMASSSTEASTCRRLAPIARSRAISLPRWATRIEKVL